MAAPILVCSFPVSYTHLDVYKRQGLYFVDLPGFPHLLKLLAQSDAGIGLPLQTDAVPKLACTGKHAAGRQMQSAKLVRAKVAARNPTTKDDGSEEESRSEL